MYRPCLCKSEKKAETGLGFGGRRPVSGGQRATAAKYGPDGRERKIGRECVEREKGRLRPLPPIYQFIISNQLSMMCSIPLVLIFIYNYYYLKLAVRHLFYLTNNYILSASILNFVKQN